MIPNSKIQEAAVEAMGHSAYVSECWDYSTTLEKQHGIQVSSSEYVIKFFHKKYKTKSREFALDVLSAVMPEALRNTVIEALKIAENLERNKEPPDHVDADRYERARKALQR